MDASQVESNDSDLNKQCRVCGDDQQESNRRSDHGSYTLRLVVVVCVKADPDPSLFAEAYETRAGSGTVGMLECTGGQVDRRRTRLEGAKSIKGRSGIVRAGEAGGRGRVGWAALVCDDLFGRPRRA